MSLCKVKRFFEFFYCSGSRDNAKHKLQLLSMVTLLPVPRSFRRVRNHRYINTFAIFPFKLVHMLNHGISRVIKAYLLNMQNDKKKNTVTLKSKQAAPKTYKSTKRSLVCTESVCITSGTSTARRSAQR